VEKMWECWKAKLGRWDWLESIMRRSNKGEFLTSICEKFEEQNGDHWVAVSREDSLCGDDKFTIFQKKTKKTKNQKKKPKFKHFPKKPSRPCWIHDRPSEQVLINDFDLRNHRSKTNLNVLK
jgi:hypothetical protein